MSFALSLMIGVYIGFKWYKAHENAKEIESILIISGNNNKVRI